eukprot:TRINITY_DN11073_c0_g1_i1.p1 TRINITY_DN11073_c0_g1~~TRINITY_DN11073_c0_g1_i1.p1  ORF type:complete len:164 (-),score=11.48 TRINITY_DN11073_c0_g1_i1:83-574(-)
MPGSKTDIMCCDDFISMHDNAKAMPSRVYAYIDDVDKVFKAAIEAGFKAIKSVYSPAARPTNMFWGDRIVALIDPYGHEWVLAQPKKDESSEIAEQAKTWESNYPQRLCTRSLQLSETSCKKLSLVSNHHWCFWLLSTAMCSRYCMHELPAPSAPQIWYRLMF